MALKVKKQLVLGCFPTGLTNQDYTYLFEHLCQPIASEIHFNIQVPYWLNKFYP